MAELREVKLSSIDPNPFRDGSGGKPPATWDTVREAYGFDEAKLKELEQSYQANGVWAGVHVRPVGSRYQLAFGHHRIEAARRLELAKVPVIVDDLSDEEMIKMMAAENSEEYGHDFALGVMNAVEAVVKAFGSGIIKLRPIRVVQGLNVQRLRVAPSFVAGSRPGTTDTSYSAETVGEYLGWSRLDGKAADKVLTALFALELIELGALKRNDLKGLGSTQARELVTLTKRKIDAEKEKLEVQAAFLEKAKVVAQKEDDKKKVKALEKKLDELQAEESKVVRAAGRQVASTVAEFHRENKSFAEASRKAAEKLDVAPTLIKSRPKSGLTLGDVDAFITRIDMSLRDTDSTFAKILLLAEEQGKKKTFSTLEASLIALADRAKLRSKELLKAVERKR